MATKKTVAKKRATKTPDFQTRANKYLKDHLKLLEKYGLGVELRISFPDQKIPKLGKLGVWLIRASQGKINMELLDKIAKKK